MPCLISQRTQVQEGNHSPMWAISRGNPTTKIAHFERMGLDGLSSNSLIFTREQAIRRREGNSLSHHHTLAHSLFFLSDSFPISMLPIFLSCTHFLTCFSLVYLLCLPSLCSVIYCPGREPLFNVGNLTGKSYHKNCTL